MAGAKFAATRKRERSHASGMFRGAALVMALAAGSEPPSPDVQRITLADALAQARRDAPGMVVARGRVARADAPAVAAVPVFPGNPTVGISLGARNVAGRVGVEWQAYAQQPIDVSGSRRARRTVSRAETARRRADVAAADWQTSASVRAAFWAAVVEGERVEIARSVEVSTKRLAAVAQARVDAGEGSQLDAALAHASLARAKERRLAASSGYLAACRELARRAGFEPDVDVAPSAELPRRVSSGPAVARLEATLTDNPGLRSIDQRIASAEASEQVARREAAPDPALGMAIQREADPTGPDQTIGFVTLSVALPIWRRRRPARARARAEATVARAEKVALQRSMAHDVRRLRVQLDLAKQRIDVYADEITPAFQANLSTTERAYELGELDLPEVLAAQRRFFEARLAALTAYADYFEARASLRALVGDEGVETTGEGT